MLTNILLYQENLSHKYTNSKWYYFLSQHHHCLHLWLLIFPNYIINSIKIFPPSKNVTSLTHLLSLYKLSSFLQTITFIYFYHLETFLLLPLFLSITDYSIFRCGSRGGLRFWGSKIEHFWALFNFSIIFFASLRSACYFFNILLFQSSNSKIFQPRFAQHMISHLKVFILSLIFTHFRLLGVHLSLSCFNCVTVVV